MFDVVEAVFSEHGMGRHPHLHRHRHSGTRHHNNIGMGPTR